MFSTPTVVGELVFIGSCAGTFYALDKKTGQVRWSYDIRKDADQNNFHADPLVTEDLIVIGTDGGLRSTGVGSVYAFEKATGKVRWRFGAGRGVATDVLRLGSNIYFVTFSDELTCIDLKSGHLVWTFRSDDSNERGFINAFPVGLADRVYFGGIDGKVYAVDAKSGRLIWVNSLGARVSNSLGLHGNYLYAGAANGHFYRLSPKTGNIEADFAVAGEPTGPPIFANDLVVLAVDHKKIICLDLASKNIRWTQLAATDWSSSRPYVWRDLVLAGDEDGEVFAFRVSDGSRQWSRKFEKVIRGIGTSPDVLYIGTLKGKVYAYVPTGSEAGKLGKASGPNEALRVELERMLEQDQNLRGQSEVVEKKYGLNSKELNELWTKQTENDKKNLSRLEEMIKRYGWPGRSLVGGNASLAAFLILQHADYEYQKKYFPLVKEAVQKGEIEPSNVALLEDRILIREGRKQIYGTQLMRNEKTGKFELSPVEDEENVDKRRATVGLPPLAEYLKTFGLTYEPPGKKQKQ